MAKRNAVLDILGGKQGTPDATPVAGTPDPAPAPVAAVPESVVRPLARAAEPKVVRLARPKAEGVDKVMLYLPHKVARKFKEIAFHEDCKAHDVYLRALAAYLKSEGHTGVAGLIER